MIDVVGGQKVKVGKKKAFQKKTEEFNIKLSIVKSKKNSLLW